MYSSHFYRIVETHTKITKKLIIFLTLFSLKSHFFLSAYGNLGSILNSQGRVDEAESAYRMALQFRPNMADVHYNL